MLATTQWIYLDLEKTGSTFLRSILLRLCADQCFTETRKHVLQARPSALPKVLTIREPVAYYFSLWSYGLDRKGGFFQQVSSLDPGLAVRMYSSASASCFALFLDYALFSPVRYPSVRRSDWLPFCCDVYTSRIISMLVPVSERVAFLASLLPDLTQEVFVHALKPHWPDVMLRTEQLNEDFYRQVEKGHLHFLALPNSWRDQFPVGLAATNQSSLGRRSEAGLCLDQIVTASQRRLILERSAISATLYQAASDAAAAPSVV